MYRAPIKNYEDFRRLVVLGRTPESRILEFKESYDVRDPKSPHELRKDVLAMANTLGGTILIGVRECLIGDRKVAQSVHNTNIEQSIEWVNSTVAHGIYPPPLLDTVSISVLDVINGESRILAINVVPFSDGIGALQGGQNKDKDWLCFPYRDDHGVKYYHQSEAIKRMNSQSRRIYIIANKLQITGKPVQISSPLFLQRMETDVERDVRLRREYGNYAFSEPRPPHLQAQMIDIPFVAENSYCGRVTEQQLEIFIQNLCFAIPLGAVLELWARVDGKLAIALKCELVLVQSQDTVNSVVRFNSR